MKAITIKVIGVVQGVGFRYYTKQKADELTIKGTVTNLNDGSVLIYAIGQAPILNQFLKWCHDGPPSSTVKSLEYENAELKKMEAFSILR